MFPGEKLPAISEMLWGDLQVQSSWSFQAVQTPTQAREAHGGTKEGKVLAGTSLVQR